MINVIKQDSMEQQLSGVASQTKGIPDMCNQLFDSETLDNIRQAGKRMANFILRCLWRILRIAWSGKVTNTAVLEGTDYWSK